MDSYRDTPDVKRLRMCSMMKKILIINPWPPYPLNSGGNQAFFNMVDYMRRYLSVSILLNPHTSGERQAVKELKKIWPDVEFFLFEAGDEEKGYSIKHPLYYKWLKKIQASVARKMRRQLVAHGTQAVEDNEVRRRGTIMNSTFRNFDSQYVDYVAKVSRMGFDIVETQFYDLLPLVYVLPDDVQTVFVHHELRYIRNQNEMKLLKQMTNEDRMLYGVARDFEKGALDSYKHLIALTETDRALLAELLGRTERIYTSPAVIRKSGNVADTFVPAQTNRLVFVGGEDHMPNWDAVIWFCTGIAPLLRQRGFKFTFQLVGKWNSGDAKRLCEVCPEMEFMGFVDELTTFLKGAISIVPIRVGSGMRMKILDAVFARVPFVTTSKGVEGLDFRSGEECLIADEASAFADAVVRLAEDEKLQEKLVQQAADKLSALYNPQEMLERRMAIYEQILGEKLLERKA